MPATSFNDLPRRISLTGEGLKAKATEEQWDVLSKQAVATYICTEEGEPCEDCDPYCGEEMRLPEAESLIPQHPNCRCWYEWGWDPSLRGRSVTSFLRASEPGGLDSAMEDDTLTRTKTATAAGITTKTPTGDDDPDGEYIRVPISSTSQDRDGDAFSEDGLKDLRNQIREAPRPVFENHGMGGGLLGGPRYDWKDILGTQVDAEIEAGDGDAGRTLYSYIKPNSENERADQLLSYIEAGQAVGFSVGFRVLDYDGDGDEDEGYEFHETDLLETSAVGIQSNPDASVGREAGTVGALAKSAARHDADLDEDTLARAIVSELVGATTRTPGDDAGLADTRTKDNSIMSDSDDDSDDEYATKDDVERLEAKIDALGDGDDPETEGDETDEKDVDEDLASEIRDLTEAIGDSNVADSETSNKSDNPDDTEDDDGSEDGTEDETAVDDEDEPEADSADDSEKAVGEEVVM